MAYSRWQTKIAGVRRICSVPFLVPPRQITSFIHFVSTHILTVEQICVPFPKGLPYFICIDISFHLFTSITLQHYVRYGGNPTCQLVTQCTQCTRCT
ncbi:MAG: hypothetical protein EZS28_033098 [Streblomastix strix]|uniref:Uncharacterized protein n=1 Tax=Streblomastix strix TaxID=222440 RepID=A0A5J4UMC1_9EUKA|nr:MAG: hypothetical protein EZS28_033098 [Streblomastix strix]